MLISLAALSSFRMYSDKKRIGNVGHVHPKNLLFLGVYQGFQFPFTEIVLKV